MRRGVYSAGVLMAALIAATSVAGRAQDKTGETITTWENLSAAPLWLAGEKPVRRRHPWAPLFRYSDDRRQVTLAAGDFVRLRLPAGEWLRVESAKKTLAAQELLVTIDNGSGLSWQTRLATSDQADTRLLPARLDYDRIVTLTRSPLASGPRRYAIYVTNTARPVPPPPTSRALPIEAPNVLVRATPPDEAQEQVFQRLAPDRRYAIAVPEDRALVDMALYTPLPNRFSVPVHVTLYVNDTPWHAFKVWPRSDFDKPLHVNQCARLDHSAVERRRWRMPKDVHRLEIEVSAEAVVRLTQSARNDYLLPTLNALATDPSPPDENDLAVLDHIDRLSEDSVHEDAGLVAAQYARRLATREYADKRVAALATNIDRVRTRYRALWPSFSTEQVKPYRRWYVSRRLRSLSDERRPQVTSPATTDYALGGLTDAVFYPLRPRQSLAFTLDTIAAGSRVKIAMDRAHTDASTMVFVQFDERPPELLQFDTQQAMPADELAPVNALVALNALTADGDSVSTAALSGGFGVFRAPAPMADVSWAELDVPPGVSRVRVTASAAAALSTAMRVASAYRVDEPTLIKRNDDRQHQGLDPLLTTLLGDVDHVPQDDTDQRVAGHWRQLARYLAGLERAFKASVHPLDLAKGNRLTRTDLTSASRRRHDAGLTERLQYVLAENDLPAAIEHAYALFAGDAGQDRPHYLRVLVQALDDINEPFLADRLLRSVWLYDRQSDVAEVAFTALETLYRDAPPKRAMLYASALPRDAYARYVPQLIATLFELGEYRHALDLAYGSSRSAWPVETLLRAAVAVRSWTLFEDLLDAPLSIERKAFWRGYRAQFFGDYDAAVTAWRDAGIDGAAYTAALAQGASVRTAMSGRSEASGSLHGVRYRDEALEKDWWHYQQRLIDLGGERWRPAPHLVANHAGSVEQYSSVHGRRKVSFRASGQRPVALHLVGPIALRLDARLLYTRADAVKRRDDWLNVNVNGEITRIPVIGDSAVNELSSKDDADAAFGRLQRHVLRLGPGDHHVTVFAKDSDITVALSVQQPLLPLSVLPTLGPGGASHVGEPKAQFEWSNSTDDAITIVRDCAIAPLAAWRSRYRIPVTTRYAEPDELVRVPFARPTGIDSSPLQRQLWHWLWRAEQAPEEHAALLVAFTKAMRSHPDTPDIDRLFARMKRVVQAGWRKLDHGIASAGIHIRDVARNDIESPTLKTRSAFLPLDDSRYLVGAGQSFSAYFNLVQPQTVEFDIELADLPFLPPAPQILVYSVNGGERVLVPLDSQIASQRVMIDLSAGDHVVEFSLRDGLTNQYALIRDVTDRSTSDQPPSETARTYHVALPNEPIEISVDGPCVLRTHRLKIDGLGGPLTYVEQHIVDQPRHMLTLAAIDDQPTLYRIYQQALDIESRGRSRQIESVSSTLPRVNVDAAAWRDDDVHGAGFLLRDHFAPGAPGRGTWALDTRWRRRSAGEVDGSQDEGAQDPERFVELRTIYRKRPLYTDRYYQGEVLLRRRQRGRPVLAFRGNLRQPLKLGSPRLDGVLKFDSSLWFQGAEADSRLDNAHTVNARLGLFWPRRASDRLTYSTQVQLFASDTSIESLPDRLRPLIDRDVYTPYRRDHDWGVMLSERIGYAPKLDSLLSARVDWITNPTVDVSDVDYAQVRLGAAQRFGAVNVDLSYRYRRYFEDDLRDSGRNQEKLQLGVYWRRWTQLDDRITLALNYARDLTAGDDAWWLGLRYAFTGGRGLRDYMPGQVPFRKLEGNNKSPWQSDGIDVPPTVSSEVVDADASK